MLVDAVTGAELILGSFEDSAGSVGSAQAANQPTTRTSTDQIRLRTIGLPALLSETSYAAVLFFRSFCVFALAKRENAEQKWGSSLLPQAKQHLKWSTA
jgi:hypothetical protein